MFTMAFFVSFLATFSLASPLRRQAPLCPWDGVPDAAFFTLLSVSKSDNDVQKPLALGSDGLLGVFMPPLSFPNDGANMPLLIHDDAEQ